MKKKDAFKLGLTLLLALTLGACQTNKGSTPAESQPGDASTSEPAGDDSSGGAGDSTSAAGDSTSAADDSSAGGDSSGGAGDSSGQAGSDSSGQEAHDPAVNISAITVIKESDNAKLQISGSAENIAAADFLWALGLEHTGSASGGDGKTGFIVGAAEFQAADYVLPATLNNDGSFVFKYDLTALTTFVAGSYFITVGVKDLGALTYNVSKPEIEILDANFRYYFRNDISNKLTVCADELPPLAFTEATIVQKDNKLWAKVGGEVSSAAITQDVLDGYDSFVNFQNTSNWSNTKRNKADGQYEWKLEGTKAYIYIDVTFFEVGGNYNTHLNVKENTQANCKMEVEINEHYNVKKDESTWLDINVYSKPSASGQSDFWGNLGFKVTKGTDPDAHVHQWDAKTTTINSDGKVITPVECAGCQKVGARIAVKDFSSYTKTADGTDQPEITGNSFKFEGNSNIVYKIVVTKAGEYSLAIYGHNENNQTAREGLSKAPYSVKVGVGEAAVDAPVSSGTYQSIGVGNGTSAEFILCPTVTLALGENVITITQGGGGNRITFTDTLSVYEK